MDTIIQISPKVAWDHLDIIVAEQAEYYGQRNAHVIAYLRHKLGAR